MFEAYNDVPKYARPYVESNRYNRFVSIPLVSTHVRISALPHTMYLQDKRRAQYYREQSDLLHVLRMQCMKSALNSSYFSHNARLLLYANKWRSWEQ